MGVPRSCRSVAKSKRSTLHESFRALRAIRGYPQSWMRQTLGCQGSACEENPIFRTYAADMQNLMPADRSMNSARGDRAFADLLPQDDWRGQACFRSRGVDITGNVVTDGVVEPRDEDKGDIARILLY